MFDHAGDLGIALFQQCQPQVVAGDPGIELIAGPGAFGRLDMAVGQRIQSVFTGPADANAFGLDYPVPSEKTHKIIHSDSAKRLHKLYKQVREIRDSQTNYESLTSIWQTIKNDYPDEWLLSLEILEIVKKQRFNSGLIQEISNFLITKQEYNDELVNLISNGLSLIDE